MFKNNPDLFPTPEHLIIKMLSKVDFRNQKVKNILEPSAGLGNIIDYINKDINRHSSSVKEETKDLTEIMKNKLNYFATKLKRDYWLEAMQLQEISSKLTSKKKKELSSKINQYANMDFTEKQNFKDFETVKEYQRIGKGLSIDTKTVLMIGA